MEDSRTDRDLLRALRHGEQSAYAVLWERHIGPALRYAHRFSPAHAEDLASEALLAVYQQVTTTSTGPEFAFRSYLKAVIRNTAIRWRKEAELVDDTVDPDRADFRDALHLVERESNARQLLQAFQELPERWQRVLWLTEVAEVARPEIARELGIKPNAVSALQRRARVGLKFHWLTSHVPPVLRDDEAHAARLFPRYLTEPLDGTVVREITDHVSSCDDCDELLLSMRNDAQRLSGVALSAVGFGALGVALPATGALVPGTGAAVAAVAAGVGVSTFLVGGIGALSVGGLLLGSLLLPWTPPAASAPAEATMESAAPAILPFLDDERSDETGAPPTAAPAAPQPSSPSTGRRVLDPHIDAIELVNDPDAPAPTAPTAPVTAPGTTPGPGPGSNLSPGVATPPSSSGYLAPVLSGVATPGAAVGLDIDGARYTPPVASDGSWTFDPRALQLPAGTHHYQAWAFDTDDQSPAETGSFTVLPIVIQGFEAITGTEDMDVAEAGTTGLVIAATGPTNGTIYVTTMQGHSAMIPLDETGQARKRLLLNSRGWYYFTFRALDADGFWGPPEEHALDVYDPDIIFDPWGPGPEEMTFELTDP
ncbi:sigma-70 family RNA polymerase sigma factor [Microbacterium paraoxydans]|uniref:sigma-70 family RNA polymerase sigma factor n=1 Tax=Microbacterium paraoxydans TaxID=199592 RepID=UPI001CFAAC41|nr:sigma-70 family RNA polymerase sigma factor [Microbacterium paraoxydans]